MVTGIYFDSETRQFSVETRVYNYVGKDGKVYNSRGQVVSEQGSSDNWMVEDRSTGSRYKYDSAKGGTKPVSNVLTKEQKKKNKAQSREARKNIDKKAYHDQVKEQRKQLAESGKLEAVKRDLLAKKAIRDTAKRNANLKKAGMIAGGVALAGGAAYGLKKLHDRRKKRKEQSED